MKEGSQTHDIIEEPEDQKPEIIIHYIPQPIYIFD